MQKLILLTLSALTLVVTSVVLSSCGKDDEKPKHPKLSFFDEDMTINENVGTIQVKVVLDKAFSKDLSIDYDINGTATEGPLTSHDYEIISDYGEVIIEAGETEGIIEIKIRDDNLFEGNETIELSIDDVNSNDVEIDLDETVITIRDNDGAPTVSFVETTLTTDETEGSMDITEIEVKLSSPAGKNIMVTYELGGTAFDTLRGYSLGLQPRYYDYYVNSEDISYSDADDITTGELVILAGQTSAHIELQLFTDHFFEDDETITLTLTDASDGVTVGTNNEFVINLLQEDGRVVVLDWDRTADIDMDMFLWLLNDEGQAVLDLDIAATPSTSIREVTFLPAWWKTLEEDIHLGLSYNYYSGTVNPMDFVVFFVDYTDGELEPAIDSDVFEASYTLANINPWDTNAGILPPIAQSIDIIDGQFANITDITVAENGSRQRESKLITPNITHTRAMAKGQFKKSKRATSIEMKSRKIISLK